MNFDDSFLRELGATAAQPDESSDSDESMDSEHSESDLSEHQSEDDEISAEEDIDVGEEEFFLSKDGLHRFTTKTPNTSGRRSRQNIVRSVGGPAPHVKPESASQSLSYFLTDDILLDLVKYTNEEARRRIDSGELSRSLADSWTPVCMSEMQAFIGILYLNGMLRGGKQRLRDLWDSDFGIQHVIAAMSRNRFCAIMKFLRFDDRNERQANDVLAPVRVLYNKFTQACRRCIIPSEFLCVDEQLVPTRGRCPFRVYMSNKPHR